MPTEEDDISKHLNQSVTMSDTTNLDPTVPVVWPLAFSPPRRDTDKTVDRSRRRALRLCRRWERVSQPQSLTPSSSHLTRLSRYSASSSQSLSDSILEHVYENGLYSPFLSQNLLIFNGARGLTNTPHTRPPLPPQVRGPVHPPVRRSRAGSLGHGTPYVLIPLILLLPSPLLIQGAVKISCCVCSAGASVSPISTKTPTAC